jgi:hypothetical protein
MEIKHLTRSIDLSSTGQAMKIARFHLLILATGIFWFLGTAFLLVAYITEVDSTNSYVLGLCSVQSIFLSRNPGNSGSLTLNLFYRNPLGQLSDEVTVTNSNFTYLVYLSQTTYSTGSTLPCFVDYWGYRGTSINNTLVVELIGHLYLQLPQNNIYLLIAIWCFGMAFLTALIYAIMHYYIWRRRRVYRELDDAASGIDSQVTLLENFDSDAKHSKIMHSFPVAQNAFWMNMHLLSELETAELKDLQIRAIHNTDVKQFQERVFQLLRRKLKPVQ